MTDTSIRTPTTVARAALESKPNRLMAAHLPRLLEAAGASTAETVAAAALVGPAQVAARILQAGAPIAFGILLDRFGASALLFSSLACMAATAALLAVASRTYSSPSQDCHE